MRYLSELTGKECVTQGLPRGWDEIAITGITVDSREVKPGYVFVAIPGAKQDGRAHIPEAIKHGASAIVTSALPEGMETGKAIVLHATNPRHALSKMAARFYPLQPRWIAAITGTDGKTSVAHFYQQLWNLMDRPSASIGTLGVVAPDGLPFYPALNTTPDPVLLHRALNDLVNHNVQHVAIEASSHGLDQRRLDGVRVKVAGFTNFTQDHLDYHHSMDAYFNAKLRLFTEVMAGGGTAVLNADDPCFAALEKACKNIGHKVLAYGEAGKGVRLLSTRPHLNGQEIEAEIIGRQMQLEIPLIGAFQVMNILCAAGMALASGAETDALAAAIPQLKGVPGRLEKVAEHASGATIFVDYAHTPGGLASVLRHVRPHVKGRLHLVFGCGGDRDRTKRAPMGKAAHELADKVYVTDDNPRSENPLLIRRDVMKACEGATEIEGREAAIMAAVQGLEAGDVLVVAGKGHEKTQIIGDTVYPFDDAEVARRAVQQAK